MLRADVGAGTALDPPALVPFVAHRGRDLIVPAVDVVGKPDHPVGTDEGRVIHQPNLYIVRQVDETLVAGCQRLLEFLENTGVTHLQA